MLALIFCFAPWFANASFASGVYVDPTIEKRIDELLEKMTLEEKIGQLNQYSSRYDLTGPKPEEGRELELYDDLVNGRVGSMLNVLGAEATLATQKLVVENSRLGIPLIFGYDVIHGYRTMFPVPLAETASWDLEAIETSARIAATEAAAAGLHWTFAPMVDVSRDSRWGRIMEGAGEDPYLGSMVAVARVRGFQGANLADIDTVAACAKHFAGYGFSEAGRDYNTVDFSESTLHNIVLPPFKAATEAGVATFMNSFNEIGGIPATASHELQTDILKDDWGFEGFIVSDWGSIQEMVQHGVAANESQAAVLALEAGNDMDMESSAYRFHLADLVGEGQVPMERVDDAVRRVLRVKFELGIMDDPYRYSNVDREKQVLMNEAHVAAARDVARKSIVLLKNEGVLPLQKKAGSIAVIGPFAADRDTPIGSWRAQGEANSAVSLLDGIQAAVGPDVEILYAEGAKLAIGQRDFPFELEINESDRSGFDAAVEAARKADTVILAIGEDAFQSGEARSQVDVGLKGVQEDLLRAVREANENLVVVLMNGRPLTLMSVDQSAAAVVEAWQLGSQSGNAIADVLFGDYNPSGKLPVSFPRHVGQEPLYYNHKNTGRPAPDTPGLVFWSHYTDVPNSPLYPFGYGLSYTTFSYSELSLSSAEMTMDGSVTVSLELSNTGDRAGTEVAQLYVRDLVGSATRPVRELKGFQRVNLDPGETRTVTFELTAKDLAYYTPRGAWEAEPGEFEVFVGGSSEAERSARFMLK
jgi:beta-glucosidase